MRLSENPFYILGVKPEDSLEKIEEAADDRIWQDEENQAKYEKARDILSYPAKRLDAEVCWIFKDLDSIYSLGYSDFENSIINRDISRREVLILGIELLYRYDGENIAADKNRKLQECVYIIRSLTSCYEELWNQDYLAHLRSSINSSRKQAGLPFLPNDKMVQDQLESCLHQDILDAFHFLMDNNSDDSCAEIVTAVFQQSIGRTIEKYVKDQTVIDLLTDAYNRRISKTLESCFKKISLSFDNINMLASSVEKRIEIIFEQINEFQTYALPLQVYFYHNGQTERLHQSQHIADELRSWAVSINNDSELPEIALKITDYALKTFQYLPLYQEKLKEDKDKLTDILNDNAFIAHLKHVIDPIDSYIVRKKGYESQNKKYIIDHKDEWITALHEAAKLLGNMEGEDKGNCSILLIRAYSVFSSACTWADLWDMAAFLAKEAIPFAKEIHDQKMVEKFSDVIWEAQKVKQGKINSADNRQAQSSTDGSGIGKFLKRCSIVAIVLLIIWGFKGYKSNNVPVARTQKSSYSVQAKSNSSTKKEESPNKEIKYSKPSVGNNREFTMAEMHWAARETIRLETMKPLIKNNEGVKAYNKMVNDYNSRASSFRYRGHSWDVAKADVEEHRQEIERDAEKEVSQNGWDVEPKAPVPVTPSRAYNYNSVPTNPPVSTVPPETYDYDVAPDIPIGSYDYNSIPSAPVETYDYDVVPDVPVGSYDYNSVPSVPPETYNEDLIEKAFRKS